MTPPFGRLLTAMVTPFDRSGEVNYPMAERLAVHLVEQGSDGLVLCGTTGESPTLTWDEEYELFKVVQKAVAGKAKVLAGTGSNSTKEAIVATQKAMALGLDGSLQVTPYYNKPPQLGLYHHFRAVAEAAPELPIMLYNIPSRTSCKIELETLLRLSEIPNIVAVKDSTGDIGLVSELRLKAPEEFAIYSGDDYLTLPLMSIGAVGVVSVASHLVGSLLKQMMNCLLADEVLSAQRIHLQLMPLFKVLFLNTNPIPVKAALESIGWDVGSVRLPLFQGDDDLFKAIKQVLADLHLLP